MENEGNKLRGPLRTESRDGETEQTKQSHVMSKGECILIICHLGGVTFRPSPSNLGSHISLQKLRSTLVHSMSYM